jgi:hypothetical protein
MENENLIPLPDLCSHYRIEVSFVRSLNDFGLLQIINSNGMECVEEDCLSEIEKLMRLHYDLEINMEGIDAISHLLKRISELQHENRMLRNRIL